MISVIGGGAAGMMAAITAARNGGAVLLFEPNDKLGRKLRITGKGRCNVTNNSDVKTVVENCPVGGKFLYSALSRFTPSDAIVFFESLGVPLKTERGNRVFPESDNANDIADALAKEISRLGIQIACTKARKIHAENGSVTGVTAGGKFYAASSVIIAAGGVSYPATGSTGDGYALAKSLGHAIIEPRGSLVPLVSNDASCAEMMGLSLRNVAITVYDDSKKKIYSDFGELLFTHFGLSGPLILSASAHMRDLGVKPYTIEINLKPALSDGELDHRIQRDFSEFSNRDFQNSLAKLLPRLIIPVIVRRSGIDPTKKCNSITKEERAKLLALVRGFTVPITDARPVSEAIITSGGVDTKEINPTTMESKIVRGLYFAGEVINADAYTGGFNLQIAWSTGFAAGTHAGK